MITILLRGVTAGAREAAGMKVSESHLLPLLAGNDDAGRPVPRPDPRHSAAPPPPHPASVDATDRRQRPVAEHST